MRSKILEVKRLALVLTVLLFASTSVFAVSDSDMCFKQPVDQCQGNQFVELGNTDADTSGKPYTFQADIINANAGDAVLQYKDSSSTSFTDVFTSSFYDGFGSTGSVFWQESLTTTVNEGSSDTLTINGNEHTFEATQVFPSSNEVETTVDGSSTGTQDVGYTFTVEGQTFQVSQATIGQQVTKSEQVAENGTLTFQGDTSSHNLNVVTVNDGNIEYNIDGGSNDFASEGETIFDVDGRDIEVVNVYFFGVNDPNNAVDLTVYEDVEQAKYTVFDSVTAPEDYNEYRVKWEESGTAQAWSDSLFFSVDLGQNIPADKQVEINNEVVDQPRTLTNVTPDSNINVTVFQGQEQDPVNVTLVKADGTEVATISQGDSYGAFRAIYDDFSDAFLSSFRGGSNQTFVFPTLSSDLLSQQSTQYQFYFKIKDKGEAGNPVRTTKMYTVNTSGTATNQPPTISNFEAFTLESGSWKAFSNISFGESIDAVRADISDPDNQYLDASLYLKEDYDGDVYFNNATYDERVGDTYTWNVNGSISVDDSGGWTAQVYASDSANNNVSDSKAWSYPFTKPKISVSAPEFVTANQFFYPSYSVWCSDYECINENETINSYLDPKPQVIFQ